MPTVQVTVNGRAHSVACEPGEEVRLKRLAQYVDRRASDLMEKHGRIDNQRVLLLTSLLLADELADAYDEIKRQRGRLEADASDSEKIAAVAIGQLAGRIEDIAARIERS